MLHVEAKKRLTVNCQLRGTFLTNKRKSRYYVTRTCLHYTYVCEYEWVCGRDSMRWVLWGLKGRPTRLNWGLRDTTFNSVKYNDNTLTYTQTLPLNVITRHRVALLCDLVVGLMSAVTKQFRRSLLWSMICVFVVKFLLQLIRWRSLKAMSA